VTDREKMEGSCSTGQSPQRAVVPVEEEEEDIPHILMYFHDNWVPVSVAWRSLTLRMEERPAIWRIASNILIKQ
jgi:hypothetical protein